MTLSNSAVSAPSMQVGRSLGSRVRGIRVRDHIAAERDSLITSARQSLLSATFLAHQAWLMIDAITRTLWRILISGRHRLEWVSAYQAARLNPSAAQVARQMWVAPALAVALGVAVAAESPARLLLALPLIALWAISPLVAFMHRNRLWIHVVD